jgi:hypothetical protein
MIDGVWYDILDEVLGGGGSAICASASLLMRSTALMASLPTSCSKLLSSCRGGGPNGISPYIDGFVISEPSGEKAEKCDAGNCPLGTEEPGEKLDRVVLELAEFRSRICRTEMTLWGGCFMGDREIDLLSPGAFCGVGGRGSVLMTFGLNSVGRRVCLGLSRLGLRLRGTGGSSPCRVAVCLSGSGTVCARRISGAGCSCD